MAEYDAGSAYVAILPSTRGFAQRLKRDIAGIRADVEVPVRPELDRRQLSGLQAALKALPAVVLTADSSPADREVAALRQRLETLNDQTVGIDISADDAHREVASVRSELERLSRQSPDIAVRVDAGAASSALQSITAETAALDGRNARVQVSADTGRAAGQLAAVQAEASRLDGRRVALNVAADVGRAVAELVGLAALVNQFATRDYSFTVRADTAAAVASVAALAAKVGALGGLAGVVGGLGGALGGLGAAGAVAGAGLGATIVASLGVGKALTAMNAQQDAAGQTAAQSAKQQQAAAYQVESAQDRVRDASKKAGEARTDAARDVSRAEQQASRAVESALEAQESAHQRLQRATRDLAREQRTLTTAWEQGRRSLEDLQDQVDGNALDQRQAAFDLADARKALAEAQAGGNADEIARAQLAVDKQVESMDQLAKRSQRALSDNQAAQKAGVAGSDAYRAALDRVSSAHDQVVDAARAAGKADHDVEQARIDGAARVAEAREQGDRQVAAADAAVADANRALAQALSQTGDAGESAALKTQAAFAKLSPEAASFVRFLVGTAQPALERLSGVASARLFPPLMLGMQALLAQEPAISGMVGTLAGATGAALQLVLTQLASPQWMGFFALLSGASTTILPALAQLLMNGAWAAAQLLAAFLPLAPASIGLANQIFTLIGALTPFLVQLLGGLIPGASAFLTALTPLGPVLGALQPILLVLAQAFSQVLGAVLTALAPILVALTPLIQALATSIAAGLVASIQTATPFLVGIATWMSQNPGLVMGVVGAIGTLMGFLKPLAFVAGLVAAALHGMLIRAAAGAVLSALGLQATVFGRGVMLLLSPLNLLQRILPLIGRAVMFLGRSFFAALGPVGWIITGLTLLYTTSEPFRQAINGLLGVVMQLVGQLAGAFMPILQALSGVLQMVAGVFGMLVGQLAMALIPVINMLAGVLMQLVGALLPPLMQIIGALVPVIMMLAQVFVQLFVSAVQPLIQLFAQLIGVILPPLVGLLTTVVVPIISFLANVIATVLVWVIQNLLVPAIAAIIPIFQALAAAAVWLWTNILSPIFSALGVAWTVLLIAIGWAWTNILKPAWDAVAAAASWLWSNVLSPIFTLIGGAWNLLLFMMQWAWNNILQPAWNAVMAAANWLWVNVLSPIFAAIGFGWNLLLTGMQWVWQNILLPVWNAIQATLNWLYTNIWIPIMAGFKAEWQMFADALNWVWLNVIKPAWDAVANGLSWLRDRFNDAVNWIGDIWGRIRGLLAKPINFMIDVVWNKGVVPAWNAVAGLVGLGPIAPLGLIPEARTGGSIADPATGGTRRGGGGKLRGPGSGTDDRILGIDGRTRQATSWVSNDEFVIREAITRRTLPFLTALNAGDGEALQAAGGLKKVTPKQFRGRSGFDMNVPRRAGGGPVEERINAAKAWLSGPAIGAPYVYGGGTNPRLGMDCSSMQSAVTHILSGRPPDSGRIGTTASMPWGGFVPGLVSAYSIGNKPSDHMAGTLAGQNVEQHGPNGTPFAFPSRWGADAGYFTQKWSLPVVGGQFVSGGEGDGSWFNWILDAARNAFDDFTNPAIDAVRAFVGEPPPEWKRVPPGLATKIRDTVRDFVFGKAGEAGGGDVAPGTGPVADQVRAVADRFGWGAGPQWDAINWIIGHENRGWDPNARNPGSSAFGLFQLLDGTWRDLGIAPSNNPGIQAEAGLRYIQRRYGDPLGAKAFWQSHNWYSGGGQVSPFDSGGTAFGRGIMLKDVIDPEQVLDPVETRDGYRPLTTVARDLESGRLSAPQPMSTQQISTMLAERPTAEFPTEFRLSDDTTIRFERDGLLRIIDGRLIAAADQISDGRTD